MKKTTQRSLLALVVSALLVSYQNCSRPMVSSSSVGNTYENQINNNSILPIYFSPLVKSDEITCSNTTTSGGFNLTPEQVAKIQKSELAFAKDRHLIIHPQPLNFAGSGKSWSDIYKENFSEIKNTFKNSESSFKIGTGLSLFALEGGTTCDLEQQLNDAFLQAETYDIPLLIHLDFEWMIEWRSDIWDLNNPLQPNNKYKVEWSNWNTPINKFAIFWDEAGFSRKSRICYPNPDIRKEVIQKGRLIAAVINKWRLRLTENNKSHLFIGVDPGWETGIQDYSQLDKAKNYGVNYELGYCALHHEGYSQANPPADKKSVLVEVVRKYAEMEAQIFFDAGIPKEKIFTHIVGTDGDKNTPPHPGRLFYQHSPLEVAFNAYSTPGFSLYPNAYYPELIKKHTQGKAWAITETAFNNFNHLKYFAGDPLLRNINIYSWDLIKANSSSINEIISLMKYPLDSPSVPTPTQNPLPAPTPAPTVQLTGTVENLSGSTVGGWACLPGTTTTQLQIYAGDFYGTKNLVTTINTGVLNSSKSSVCSGNNYSGFSYQFTQKDKTAYQGKSIHIKALADGKELWLYKSADFTVPAGEAITAILIGSVENMSGSTISGWACLPGTTTTQLQIYAGDFYGTKNLVTTINTGLFNSSKSTVCAGNNYSGFSYQFTQNDINLYPGKDIHIKALVDGKELWLFKPANFTVPNP